MGLFEKLKATFKKNNNTELKEYETGLTKTREEFVSKLNVLGIKFTKINNEYFDERLKSGHQMLESDGDPNEKKVREKKNYNQRISDNKKLLI